MKKPTKSRKVLSSMPGFIKPQLAALKMKAPSGVDWIHEIKYDG
jgi:bifunctional non-homologous end joining protein LigD